MTTHYIVGAKQLLGAAIMVGIFTSTAIGFVMFALNSWDIPEVHRDRTGKCVKVVNYKNGDGYACQDVDVTLRKYTLVHVDPQH
jgi:hypothetical protein